MLHPPSLTLVDGEGSMELDEKDGDEWSRMGRMDGFR